MSSTLTTRGELGGARDAGLVRLLAFARSLQSVRSFGELLAVARAEVERSTGYRHAWLLVQEEESDTLLRLIEVASPQRASLWGQRVDALRQLVGIEATNRLYAARGQSYDAALVSID